MGTVAFKVSIQYWTASREFFLWADDTAIITLASPIGTTLQIKMLQLFLNTKQIAFLAQHREGRQWVLAKQDSHFNNCLAFKAPSNAWWSKKKKILLLIYEQTTAVTWGLNLSFELLTISLVTLYKIIN